MRAPNLDEIIVALTKSGGNITRAAKKLDMPISDLRRLTRMNPTLVDVALELVEQHLDQAEQKVWDGLEAQHIADRLRAADIMLRSHQARKRGWGLGRQGQAPTEGKPIAEIKWVEK